AVRVVRCVRPPVPRVDPDGHQLIEPIATPGEEYLVCLVRPIHQVEVPLHPALPVCSALNGGLIELFVLVRHLEPKVRIDLVTPFATAETDGHRPIARSPAGARVRSP